MIEINPIRALLSFLAEELRSVSYSSFLTLILSIAGASLHGGEAEEPMQVAVCPRLVHGHDRDEPGLNPSR